MPSPDAPAAHPAPTLEVEEAELSSDDERPAAPHPPPSQPALHPRSSASEPPASRSPSRSPSPSPSPPPRRPPRSPPPEDDFVLEDSSEPSSPSSPDRAPASPRLRRLSRSRSRSRSPSISRSPSRSHSRSPTPSSSDRARPSPSPPPPTRTSRARARARSPPSSGSRSSSRSSSHSRSPSPSSSHPDDDRTNGAAHHDSPAVPKRARGNTDKLVIPNDMRDDDRYFRRSSRARNAPERLSISPPDSPSSIGSDSDFKAEQGNDDEDDDDDELMLEEEEEDDEPDDDDDDDYSTRPRKRRSTRARQPSRRRPRQRADNPEANPFATLPSESDSDCDWRADASSKPKAGRRRRPKSSKRLRARDFDEDEDVARTARINSRTGDAVNYAESDDEFLDSDEDAAAPADQLGADQDDNTPRVERVCDYNPIGGRKPLENGELPFSDFDPHTVQFNIKWVNKSFRKNTWETLADLKIIRGFKKVTNYIKLVEERRAYLQQKGVAPEELEESQILMEENRTTLKTYEVVDRVIAQREGGEDHSQAEYFVKWADLPYSECTWEPRAELSSDADLKAIDDYNDREQAVLGNVGKKRYNPFNVKDERPRFKRMVEQPDFLHGEGRTLRPYQLAGLNFLAFSWTKRNNVILADEMGLGKTLQTISFLGWLMYARNVQGPFLVVVPLSTIAAWVREFARWLPDLNVLCYTGDGQSRSTVREYEFWATSQGTTEKFHVLLTTPELLMLDQDYLNQIRWAMIAVDEAHRLKNEGSSLHLTLASLRSANRLLVTGTPLQNSVRELWALLHFLNPDVFQHAEEFEESFSFSALRDPERVSSLHKTLRPYIIRRQKSDVEKSLPKKTYAVLRVGMTSAQQQYYRWLLTKNFAKLNMGTKGRGTGTAATLRNLVMELKKCCNHPFLFPNYEDMTSTTTVKDLTRASGKMILLDKLLVRLREKGHRVLIFSQMVRMLDILQDYCRMRQFPFQRLDGSMHNDIRQRAVDHYNAPDSTDFIFLLSTRAGGLGINLATADTVIIFDSDWNPQNDLQAESRAHRIGQKKDVKVFRLLSRETVEEDILERAKRKRVLEHLVIHGVEGGDQGEGKDPKMAFKKEELSAILRFGAEKLFEKDRVSGEANPMQVKEEPEEEQKDETDAPTAQDAEGDDKDETAEEKRVLEVDDIDELLARAPTDEASQVGASEPSVGDSLLNAFKWADFKTVEEEDEEEEKVVNDNDRLAREAANRIVVIDKEASKAKQHEDRERHMMAREGDSEFWDRVIPGEMKDRVVAEEVVLGTRRRKRTKTFNADSPKDGKRRRVTRAGRSVNGKVTDQEELTAKEQRSLFRSLRKFGDPGMIQLIVKDAGLEDRIDEDLASSLILEALARARSAVEEAKEGRSKSAKRIAKEEDDPAYGSDDSKVNGKEGKTKSPRVVFDVLGERGADAADLLKRCEDLQMLRNHIRKFDVDTQFRLRRLIKAPAYNVRWKPHNDAMLLVGVFRYGFGNWTQIAADKQLHLADKMNVHGNTECKPGAPDTTKLTRRVITLLRELEREVHPPVKKKKSGTRDRTESRATEKKKSAKVSQKKIAKKAKASSRSDTVRGRGSSRTKKSGSSAPSPLLLNSIRGALKKENLATLKELRSLSKENNKLDKAEKIKRTKDCLLVLGRAIDKQAKSAKPRSDPQTLHPIRRDLWKYVHEVCRTNLAGDRLQGIYDKLAGIPDDSKAESSQ